MILSTMDCPIARTAIEHGQVLLHNASNFDNVEKVIPVLTLA
jgi:predicted nucleic acid-binding protein